MPQSRMIDRLGLPQAALQLVATAQASQTAPSTVVATKADSNIIDTYTVADRRYLALANIVPLATGATGNATVSVLHGTATNAMSAASVGTGTTPMQATGAIGSAGGILALELQGADLVGKNRYLQFRVTPGTNLVAAVALDVIAEARYNSPTTQNTAALATPVVVSDL